MRLHVRGLCPALPRDWNARTRGLSGGLHGHPLPYGGAVGRSHDGIGDLALHARCYDIPCRVSWIAVFKWGLRSFLRLRMVAHRLSG